MRIAARAAMILAVMILAGCSATRHVPPGKLLLDDVSVEIHDTTGTLGRQQMLSFVRQRPNNKFFQLARLRLGVYNMSGNDSASKWNKWIRKLGEPPVIFDPAAAETDASQLLKAMNNAGFLHASVRIDSFPNPEKKRTKLRYVLDPGARHRIGTLTYEFPNDTIRDILMKDSSLLVVHEGDPLDRALLERQRELMNTRLQNRGYWAFSKDFITFNADTTRNSLLTDLTLTVHPPVPAEKRSINIDTHRRYIVRNVYYIPDYDPGEGEDPRHYHAADTVRYKDITILYGRKRHLSPDVLYDNCFIRSGRRFSERDINRTYQALGRLQILKFTNIRIFPSGKTDNTGLLDVYILLTRGRSQSFSAELEGTNSEGDFGVAASVQYSHRNIGKGSETLNVKLRGSYEALSGDFSQFIHNRMLETGIEASIQFPKFKFPFLRDSFKRRVKASSAFHFSMNYQERPEYTRIISTLGWSYRWTARRDRIRYTLTPIDINYVYLPQSTNNFIDQIAPDNPLLRYSYEYHFIMRAGFNYYYTNKRTATPWNNKTQRNTFTVRANAEIAGNVLFALSSIFDRRHNFKTDPYKIFGINYSQYFRVEGDFSYLHVFNSRHALACNMSLGLGVPYGNSSILPFEKRFYGGGANGVSGWEVRTLGPGRYPGSNSVSDFIHQCGDIRMKLSMEYRVKLFWVLEGAIFVDAGNIWTIRDYTSQPYGAFAFNSFYKEFATSYGIGLRMDFNYFLIRFDLGMKAHDPAVNREPWPLIHPRWGRDHAFHFSIGYPF